MNYGKDYFYIKYETSKFLLSKEQENKIKEAITEPVYKNAIENDQTYLISYDNNIAGFFSFEINKDHVNILCIYVKEKYRNLGLATYAINNTIWATKQKGYDIKYVTAMTPVKTCMFYFKKGFDYCKINNEYAKKRKNLVIMYRKVS